MEWNDLAEEVKGIRYKLYNGQTGQYVCDINGKIKIFDTKEEVVAYIKYNHLSTVYEIKEC